MGADRNRVREVFRSAVEVSPEQRSAFLTDACGDDAELRAEVDRLLATNADPESILDPPADATTDFVASHPGTVPLPGRTPATDASDPGAPSPNDLATEDRGPYGATGTFAPPDPHATTAAASASSAPHAARAPTDEGIGTVIAGRYTLVEVIGEGGMGSVYRASQTEPVKRQVALKLIKTGMARPFTPRNTRLLACPEMWHHSVLGFFAYPLEKVYSRPRSVLTAGSKAFRRGSEPAQWMGLWALSC
jgi:serine/threonine-protein kinase